MAGTSSNGDSGAGTRATSSTTLEHAAETVHAHSLSDESFAPGTVSGKVCCVCGKDVAHEERFKDKKGRYWCYECGVADSHKRHQNDLVKCPDCGGEVPESDMGEYEGHHFCKACVDKRAKAAKREAARKAAAEEAAREAEKQRKRIIIGSVSFVVVAIAVAVYALM